VLWSSEDAGDLLAACVMYHRIVMAEQDLSRVKRMTYAERRQVIQDGVVTDLESAPADLQAFADRAARRVLGTLTVD